MGEGRSRDERIGNTNVHICGGGDENRRDGEGEMRKRRNGGEKGWEEEGWGKEMETIRDGWRRGEIV